MGGFIFFVIIATIVALVIYGNIVSTKNTSMAWRAAANHTGTHFYPATSKFSIGSIKGEVDGCHVIVDIYTSGSGNSKNTFTRYRISYPKSLHLGLRISKQHFYHGMGVSKFFGVQDIEVGDETFDNDVVIKGNNPQKVSEFLNPFRRKLIIKMINLYPKIIIEDKQIIFSDLGIEKNSQLIAMRINHFLDLAKSFKIQKKSHSKQATEIVGVDENLEKLKVSKHVKEQTKSEPDQEDKIVFSDHQKEILTEFSASPSEQVTPEPTLIPAELPPQSKPEPVADIIEQDAVPETEELAAAAEVIEEVLPEKISTSACVTEVCSELFNNNVSSFDAAKLFDDQFKGQEVEWEGTLKSAQKYWSDLIFKGDAGTKATCEIYEYESGYSTKYKVQAVIQLSESVLTELSTKTGQKIKFSGKLIKADGLMRNLYVADGKLG